MPQNDGAMRDASEGLTGFLEAAFPAEPRYLGLVRRLLTAIAERSGFSREQTFDAALCLSEAFTNVIRHARTNWAVVRVAVDPLSLRVEVQDDGAGFDRRRLDRTRAGSGWGFQLIHRLMDGVEVETAPSGTLVRMTKLRRPAPAPLPAVVRYPSSAVARIKRTIARYERDLGLMLGAVSPADDDLDDLAILERFVQAADRDALVNDRKLRIKTLEATLDILREEAGEAAN